MKYHQALTDLLSNHTVNDVANDQEIIEIEAHEVSLTRGFEILLERNLQSVPVYDTSSASYLGFLDIRDLISFICFVYDKRNLIDTYSLNDIVSYGKHMFKANAIEGITLSYMARKRRFSPVDTTAPLTQVVKILSQGSYRVPVLENGRVVKIISHSLIIQFISEHLNKIPMLAKTIISNIPELGTSPVLTVTKETKFIQTLKLMDKHGISGIAIVDKDSKFVGTTTAKDLGLLMQHPMMTEALESPVFNYLAKMRQTQVDIRNPTICIYEQDHLAKLVLLFSATKIHRLFVVKEHDFKPNKVISLFDIIRFLHDH